MSRYAFGVDIGGTSVKMGLFDGSGSMLDKWEIPTHKADKGVRILPDIADSIASKLTEKGIMKEEVAGIGIGAPGPVDDEGTVRLAVNIGWDEVNIPKVLGSYLNFPIKAANDANIAAFGEMWQGGGKGCVNLVAVTLGTGVGGGIIVNGNILAGAVGAGGEIGHLHIEDKETELCGCKNKGCLEQYTSATGIVRLAKRRLANPHPDTILDKVHLSAKAIFDAVKQRDEVAIDVAREFGAYLGKGLAIVAAITNPEIFVIGGGVSHAGKILFEFIQPEYERYAFPACRNAKFVLAELGNDAGIYGAAGLILDQ